MKHPKNLKNAQKSWESKANRELYNPPPFYVLLLAPSEPGEHRQQIGSFARFSKSAEPKKKDALRAHLISLRVAQEALPPGPPLSPEGRGATHFALGTLLLRLSAPPARQGVRCFATLTAAPPGLASRGFGSTRWHQRISAPLPCSVIFNFTALYFDCFKFLMANPEALEGHFYVWGGQTMLGVI